MKIPLIIGIAGVLTAACHHRASETIPPVQGAGGDGYQCKAAVPIRAQSAWPRPANAKAITKDIFVRVVKPGRGERRPIRGSGTVVVLCVTHYNTDGSVREYDPAVIHELDPPGTPWDDVITQMTEGEILRVWMPDHESPNGRMIADFELQPFPTMIPPRAGAPKKK
jgi:hypothetical protein